MPRTILIPGLVHWRIEVTCSTNEPLFCARMHALTRKISGVSQRTSLFQSTWSGNRTATYKPWSRRRSLGSVLAIWPLSPRLGSAWLARQDAWLTPVADCHGHQASEDPAPTRLRSPNELPDVAGKCLGAKEQGLSINHVSMMLEGGLIYVYCLSISWHRLAARVSHSSIARDEEQS